MGRAQSDTYSSLFNKSDNVNLDETFDRKSVFVHVLSYTCIQIMYASFLKICRIFFKLFRFKSDFKLFRFTLSNCWLDARCRPAIQNMYFSLTGAHASSPKLEEISLILKVELNKCKIRVNFVKTTTCKM